MWIVIIKERQLAPETDDGFVEEIVGVFDGFADEDSAIGWSGMFVDAADRDFRADVRDGIKLIPSEPRAETDVPQLAAHVKTLVDSGSSWEELGELVCHSVPYLKKIVKDHC